MLDSDDEPSDTLVCKKKWHRVQKKDICCKKKCHPLQKKNDTRCKKNDTPLIKKIYCIFVWIT